MERSRVISGCWPGRRLRPRAKLGRRPLPLTSDPEWVRCIKRVAHIRRVATQRNEFLENLVDSHTLGRSPMPRRLRRPHGRLVKPFTVLPDPDGHQVRIAGRCRCRVSRVICRPSRARGRPSVGVPGDLTRYGVHRIPYGPAPDQRDDCQTGGTRDRPDDRVV